MGKGLPTGSLYLLLYKKMAAEGGVKRCLSLKNARSIMARPIGLDKVRAEQVLQELEAYGLVAGRRNGVVQLNDVVVENV